MTRRHPFALTTVALASALALAGCGSSAEEGSLGQSGPSEVAASVGDHEVTVGDVQEATRGTNAFLKERGAQQTIGTRDILTTLMFAPQLVGAGADAGVDVPSAKAVSNALEGMNLDADPATVEFIRAQSVREQLTPEQLQTALADVGTDIKVNPRYGSFDPATGLTASAPNWLEAEPTTATDTTTP